MNQLERLEHILSLCSSARGLASPAHEPLITRLLDMLLLELGETLAHTPGHRVRASRAPKADDRRGASPDH